MMHVGMLEALDKIVDYYVENYKVYQNGRAHTARTLIHSGPGHSLGQHRAVDDASHLSLLSLPWLGFFFSFNGCGTDFQISLPS